MFREHEFRAHYQHLEDLRREAARERLVHGAIGPQRAGRRPALAALRHNARTLARTLAAALAGRQAARRPCSACPA